MQNDMQVWQLILQASWMVKIVMAVLLVASVSSWMIIFRKRQVLKKAAKGAVEFEERFWSGTDLNHLYELVSRNTATNTGDVTLYDITVRDPDISLLPTSDRVGSSGTPWAAAFSRCGIVSTVQCSTSSRPSRASGRRSSPISRS